MAAVLAVAAISARLLAETARQDGYEVVAMDLFGDADTRRAAAQWQAIGADQGLRIDPDRVRTALQALAQRARGEVVGWVPGSGFEGQPALLEEAAQWLPLIGTAPADVRRVRDPHVFFDTLGALGLPHPELRFEPPADTSGWLYKDAHACGGWHIRHAADAAEAMDAAALPHPHHAHHAAPYFQREMPGTPMSLTFIANGHGALVLGVNELLVRPMGRHPHVYCGCIGPVPVSTELARHLGEAARQLSAAFGLRGWCSLDFIRDGEHFGLLEVNPRPPASMALYARRGSMDAQLRACLLGELPRPTWFTPPQVSGSEIVYARQSLQIDAARAERIATAPDTHDHPAAGTTLAAGEPVCSLSSTGHSAAQVKAQLARARENLLNLLET